MVLKKISDLLRKELVGFEVREYAASVPHRDDMIDLSLNINPCGVSSKVIDALKKIDPSKINHYYTENLNLHAKIAEYVGSKNDQIMLGDGCDGCLQMIADTFINEGDEVIIPVPTFHRYEFHTRLMGGVPVFVEMKDFKMDASKILAAVNEKTKMIFLCNPNNPTGLDIETHLEEQILKGFNGILVIDEALADATNINGASLLKKYKNLVIVRSFSKTFGLASLRIGYLIAHNDVISQVQKTSSPFKVNGVAQELALMSLSDKEYIDDSKKYIEQNRRLLINGLEELGLPCTPSLTTNILVDITKISNDSTELSEKLAKLGVLVTDAKTFRVPHDRYIRISISSKENNLAFLKIMKDVVSESGN